MSASTGNYDDVMSLNARLANISTPSGYALGLETETGVLNVTATGAALGLPAPKDVDDLLQNGLGDQVRAIRNAIVSKPEMAVLVPTQEVKFAPLVYPAGEDHLHRFQLPEACRGDWNSDSEGTAAVRQVQQRPKSSRRCSDAADRRG